jgi:branched-chain amino acid transport system permease protein
MYVLVALGFSFLFSMLGILNLAHGAIYMIGGYVGYMLIAGAGINHWIGLFATMIVVGAFGLFLEKYCFRPFVGDFNRVVMICVAITTVLQTIVNIVLGERLLAIPTFAEGIFKIGSISISNERAITFAICAVALAAVTWFVYRTKSGRQMQAIAQNLEGALLQGIKVHRISALACVVGCALAGLAGCLMGAYLRLDPFIGDFMLLKLLMLVMMAGVGSFGGIMVAGVILGSLDAILPRFMGGAISDAITVCIVVIILLIRPMGFFGHEAEMASESPPAKSTSSTAANRKRWTRFGVCIGLVSIAAFLPLMLESLYTVHILILAFVYVIASVSLRTITVSGQFPLAHAAYMGIGAYVSGMAAKWLGWSPWVTIPAAVLITTCIGILVSYPFSRLRTLYYALGSLFFGVGVLYIITAGGVWTGGYSGLRGIPPLFDSTISYYYTLLGLTLVSIIALYRFEFSRIGTSLRAISQSHLVASSVGINEGFYRIFAVAVGCFFVGLAGALYAHYNQVLSPSAFNLGTTLLLVTYVLIGGVNSLAGPIVGSVILFLVPEFFRDLKIYTPFVTGGMMIVVVYLMPEGMVGLPKIVQSWFTNRKRGGHVA